MKVMKTVVLTVAAVLMIGVMFAGAVSAAPTSGTSGGIDWQVTGTTLTITLADTPDEGYVTGQMVDYGSTSDIPWYANQSTITSVKLPDGLKNIGSMVFSNCNALTSIEIPASVETIDLNAFMSSAALKTVTFAKGSKLTTIGQYAFGATGLTSIEIPASVTIISANAFTKCSALTEVTFADVSKLKKIGKEAFSSCTALKKVVLKKGTFPATAGFGVNLFNGCMNFTTVISDKLQTSKVMGKFVVSEPGNGEKKPVWYISEKQTASLPAGYNNYFIGLLNGGTLKANFVQQIDSSNIYILPIAEDVTRKGYAFDKWVNNGDEVTTLTDCWMNATLKWTPVIYTINYVLDGGTNHADNPATYTIESEDITLQDATWDGYTFDGWYEDAAFTEEITEIAKGSTGNKVLYAKWTPLATGHSPSLPKEYTTPSSVPVMVQETVQPTASPTPTPAAPTMMPTSKPTTQQTQKSPAPVAGLVLGLGAAALLMRMRR